MTKGTPVDPLKATEEDIPYAYKLILRRDPDPAGLAHYTRRVGEKDFLRTDLIGEFMTSDEYFDLIQRDQRASEAAVDLGGYQVVVQKHELDFGRFIYNWQRYEEPVRQAIRARLKPGDVVLDIGANVGVMALLAASVVGDSGRVIAVEPNPDNVQLLYRGIVLNQFTNVEVLPLAASDRCAVSALSGRRSNTEIATVDTSDQQMDERRLVQSVVLDDVLSTMPRLDLIKLDIEGHEPAALRGLGRLVTTFHPTLVSEFNPRCLAIQHEDPAAHVKQILSTYPRVRAISHFEDDMTFDTAEALMSFWHRRDAEVTAEGLLPAGTLHFDLIAERD